MAQVQNPRKQFNFTISFPGFPLNPFLVQKVTLPEISVDQVSHGDFNFEIKTGGRKKIGNLKLENIMSTTVGDNAPKFFYDWMDAVQSTVLGGGLNPSNVLYKRIIYITELAEDNTTPLNTWTCLGCWPTKIDAIDLDRMKSENTMESIEISVDECIKN